MRWLARPRTRDTGQAAEQQAERYLHEKGLRSVQRNFHARGGEIDLVMRDADTLVFVEVRFRKNNTHGTPLETVTAHKQARIRRAASYFLQSHPAMAELPCRFDVIGIEPDAQTGRVTISWIQDAFS
ncbi:MAG TPA: YraN family protein [Pseudomonadales bacterium]|jgi:putative endonuclease